MIGALYVENLFANKYDIEEIKIALKQKEKTKLSNGFTFCRLQALRFYKLLVCGYNLLLLKIISQHRHKKQLLSL